MRKVTLVLLSVVLISSCFSKAVYFKHPMEDNADGIWLTQGYNVIFEIEGQKIQFYELTDISLLQQKPYFLLWPSCRTELIDENTMAFYIEDSSYYWLASRIDKIPEREIISSTKNLQLNYEVFMQTFNENYSFFELRGVDWADVYQTYKKKVELINSEDELYSIFIEILSLLEDEHTMLQRSNSDELWTYMGNKPSWANVEAYIEAQKIIYQKTLFGNINSGILAKIEEEMVFQPYFSVIKSNYLDGDFDTVCNGQIWYGIIDNDIGYINILREECYTNDKSDDPKLGLLELSNALDLIVEDFSNVKAIIIDSRFNLGGNDRYNQELLSRFIDESKLVTWHIPQQKSSNFVFEYWVEPKLPSFNDVPVYNLISNLTVSAGECQAVMLDILPETIRLGNRTSGAFSNTQIRHLPNGWMFTLSNETYYSHDGNCYEFFGFSPDVQVNFNQEGFSQGSDQILDAAINMIIENS